MTYNDKRYATVFTARPILDGENAAALLKRVEAYLPRNYTAKIAPTYDQTNGYVYNIVIEGHDDSGWTLDGYVLPRLASGNIYANETDPPFQTVSITMELPVHDWQDPVQDWDWATLLDESEVEVLGIVVSEGSTVLHDCPNCGGHERDAS